MHTVSDINLNNLSKIEGHATLKIKIKDKKVISTKLKVTENKRFYTQAIRGLSIDSISSIVSRICGTCSLSHMTCCIEALENALDIHPSEQTLSLRHLSMNATILRDHAMHLYFFCLPDLFNMDSVLEFDDEKMKYVKEGLAVKKAANNLATIVAGRAVHALYPKIGGFSKIPSDDQIKKSIKELASVRENVISLISLFFESEFELYCSARNVGLCDKRFNFINGSIKTSDNKEIRKKILQTIYTEL
jgi:coenzyme F420-reducing hydrogenase alpha subunit